MPKMPRPASSQEQAPASAIVTTSDTCGQFVANLTLALFACHLQKQQMSRSYIEHALSNIVRLSSEACTIRSANPMKLVRLVSEGFGSTETILLPILDDVLLLPSLDMKEAAGLMRAFSPCSPVLAFTDISIIYHRVRLRIFRVRQALNAMAELKCAASLADLIQDTLTQCLYPAVQNVNALDQADDYLTLALNFARIDNYPLAAAALAKARSALRAFELGSNQHIPSARMDRAWESLENLERTLGTMAS